MNANQVSRHPCDATEAPCEWEELYHMTSLTAAKLRSDNKELVETLACAETVLILLKTEVSALGLNAKYVLPRVQKALSRAAGL